MFATPCFSAENPTWDYCSFCSLVGIKRLFLFMVVMASVITPPWSLIFDEISFCYAMPNCVVILIVKPTWHCSLFEKQEDIYCKSYDILYLLFCNTVKLLNLLYIVNGTILDRREIAVLLFVMLL